MTKRYGMREGKGKGSREMRLWESRWAVQAPPLRTTRARIASFGRQVDPPIRKT